MEIIRHPSAARPNFDQTRWDKRYREGRRVGGAAPDPWVQAQARWLTGGRALDIACGRGRHTLWLARLGYQVDAVDISARALGILADALEAEGLARQVRLIHADLTVWKPESNAYDLILVTRYLNRELIASFAEALRPQGMALYLTFNSDWKRLRSDFQRGILLQPGELARLFADWEWLAYEERRLPPGGTSHADCTSAILARKRQLSVG